MSEQYRLAGQIQQALEVERARFQAHPDEATYRAVHMVVKANSRDARV